MANECSKDTVITTQFIVGKSFIARNHFHYLFFIAFCFAFCERPSRGLLQFFLGQIQLL